MRRWSLCVLAYLVGALPVGAAGGPDLPAEVLRAPSPVPPIEAAGSGVASKVTVRFRVDVRGMPAGVDILRVTPSTGYDAAFERATRDTVTSWRFAPALHDGKPVETSVDLTIEYSATDLPGPDAGKEPAALGADRGRDNAQRWLLYVSGLPPKERARLRNEVASRAQGLLREVRSQAKTDHFVVLTDSPTAQAADVIATNLEAVFGTVARMFGDLIPPLPTSDRVLVVGYRFPAPFFALAAGRDLANENLQGFYDPAGVLAFHLAQEADEVLTGVMLHEGVHAFLHRHVVRSGIVLPLWLDEGFAQYVQNSEIVRGKIVLGATRQRKVAYHTPLAPVRRESQGRMSADEVKKAVRSGDAIPLEQLVSTQREEFYGPKYRLFYTQAWMLVHFLRHGRPGWAEKEFPRFFMYLAEGFTPGEVFRSVYGCDPKDLSAEFRQYVERF